MATRDMFLDALTAPAPRAPRHDYGPSVGVGPAMRPTNPHPDSQLARDLAAARAENERLLAARAKPVAPPPAIAVVGPLYKPGTRPSFADDIDRMVRELVDAGEIALDTATDTYRSTRYRHLRFSEG